MNNNNNNSLFYFVSTGIFFTISYILYNKFIFYNDDINSHFNNIKLSNKWNNIYNKYRYTSFFKNLKTYKKWNSIIINYKYYNTITNNLFDIKNSLKYYKKTNNNSFYNTFFLV